jgi:hypothetical protein
VKYIKPTLKEAWAGIEAMMKEVKAPFDLKTG